MRVTIAGQEYWAADEGGTIYLVPQASTAFTYYAKGIYEAKSRAWSPARETLAECVSRLRRNEHAVKRRGDREAAESRRWRTR